MNISNGDVEDVFRDGRVRDKDDRGRPFSRIVKLKFGNFRSKMNFLKGFRNAKDVGLHAYARHDLTWRQREVDKVLKARLIAVRAKYPNDSFYIYRGEIVRRNDARGHSSAAPAPRQAMSQS